MPVVGDDVSWAGSLHLPGLYLIHELGMWEETCWCEPEVIGYDYDLDIYHFRHRRNQ